MGAISFVHEVTTSRPVRNVIRDMQKEAEERYGDDPYSGTIATCDRINRTVVLAATYSKSIEPKATAYLEQDDYGRKREVSVLDLGICGFEKVTIKKKIVTSKRKTKVVFCLRNKNEKFIRSFEDKEKATEAMMKYATDNQEYCYLTKETCQIEGTPVVMEAEVTRRSYKSKPKDMKDVYPIHKYIIYGWAAN